MNIGWWIYFFSNEFRWWACELLCSFLLPSEGVPACCDCCASLASLYTSHTPSMSFYEIVSIFYWTPNINPFFCLCVLCASVSVSCVLLPRNCRRRRAWCYGLNRWLWLVMAGYGWLWGSLWYWEPNLNSLSPSRKEPDNFETVFLNDPSGEWSHVQRLWAKFFWRNKFWRAKIKKSV